jgi:hypothetical protein
MAKMFYTVEEVCSKLEKNEDEVRELVRSGQIQEFRDRDKLMFKVEQIDLLASGEEDTSDLNLELEGSGGSTGIPAPDDSSIGLADSRVGLGDSRVGLADSQEGTGYGDPSNAGSSSGLGLADSRDAISLADSREGTGVSIFDTDHGDETGTGDKTTASEAIEEELSLDAVGSGSGLLDLTRESDDTSLGAELLEEVYASEENLEIPAHASGLFEAASAERPVQEVAAGASAVGVPMVMEIYDGSGSGLGAGLLIGAVAALVCVAIVAIVGVGGATSVLATKIAATDSSIWMWAGGLAGLTIVLGLVGLFIGKASG